MVAQTFSAAPRPVGRPEGLRYEWPHLWLRSSRVRDSIAVLLCAVDGDDAGRDEMYVGERVGRQLFVDRVGVAAFDLPRDVAGQPVRPQIADREVDAALDLVLEAAAVDVGGRRLVGLRIDELLRLRQV